MNAKISVFVIHVEAIIYLLLYNLHDCTFNGDIGGNQFCKSEVCVFKKGYTTLDTQFKLNAHIGRSEDVLDVY